MNKQTNKKICVGDILKDNNVSEYVKNFIKESEEREKVFRKVFRDEAKIVFNKGNSWIYEFRDSYYEFKKSVFNNTKNKNLRDMLKRVKKEDVEKKIEKYGEYIPEETIYETESEKLTKKGKKYYLLTGEQKFEEIDKEEARNKIIKYKKDEFENKKKIIYVHKDIFETDSGKSIYIQTLEEYIGENSLIDKRFRLSTLKRTVLNNGEQLPYLPEEIRYLKEEWLESSYKYWAMKHFEKVWDIKVKSKCTIEDETLCEFLSKYYIVKLNEKGEQEKKLITEEEADEFFCEYEIKNPEKVFEENKTLITAIDNKILYLYEGEFLEEIRELDLDKDETKSYYYKIIGEGTREVDLGDWMRNKIQLKNNFVKKDENNLNEEEKNVEKIQDNIPSNINKNVQDSMDER